MLGKSILYFSQDQELSEEMVRALDVHGTDRQVLDVGEESIWVYQIGDCAVSLSYAERTASIQVHNKDLDKRNESIGELEKEFA